MTDALQIIFAIAILLGIAQGYTKLSPPRILTAREPDIYFIITDLYHTK